MRRVMQFCYKSQGDCVFMDLENFEQIVVSEKHLAPSGSQLRDEMVVGLEFSEGGEGVVTLYVPEWHELENVATGGNIFETDCHLNVDIRSDDPPDSGATSPRRPPPPPRSGRDGKRIE